MRAGPDEVVHARWPVGCNRNRPWPCAVHKFGRLGAGFPRTFLPDVDGYVQRDHAKELNAKAITWKRLAEIIGDRGRPGVRATLDWRLNNT